MKIEVGKYYKTRDGRKVGPMEVSMWSELLKARIGGPSFLFNISDGTHGDRDSCFECIDNQPELDLIEEWRDEPKFKVRKVVSRCNIGKVEVTKTGSIWMQHTDDPKELRDAAATIIEIADALEVK